MKIKSILLAIIICGFSQYLYAHALWLETTATGKIGQPQAVKIFYGEYGENIHEEVEGKFKDMKGFTLWLTAPDGQKTQLIPTPQKDFFTATFTPNKPGAYALLLENLTLAVVDTKGSFGVIKPAFYASTVVTVGNIKINNDTAYNPYPLHVYSDISKVYKKGDSCSFYVSLRSKPLAQQEINVYSPTGWGKVLTSNAEGKATFPALWKGTYVVDVVDLDKTAGDDKGKAYQTIRHVATYTLTIKD